MKPCLRPGAHAPNPNEYESPFRGVARRTAGANRIYFIKGLNLMGI
jgi:hypothetical protein